LKKINNDNLDSTDQWILSRLNRTIKEIDIAYSDYKINEAIKKVYNFIWADYCDWYIEFAKTRFYGSDKQDRNIAQSVSVHIMRETLKLLHPYCPFITEELWSYFKTDEEKMLILTTWPQEDEKMIDNFIEDEVQVLMDVISSVRNIRSSLNVSPGKEADLIIRGEQNICNSLSKHKGFLQRLAKLDEIHMGKEVEKPSQSATVVIKGLELFVPLSGLIDINKEVERLTKQIHEMEARLASVNKKMDNKNFVDRAPENVIDHERGKQKNYQEDLLKLNQNLNSLQK